MWGKQWQVNQKALETHFLKCRKLGLLEENDVLSALI
jgi:hypothetical protein